jgi:hypothetical protein
MTYLVRIELHDANRLDYDTLHAAMVARGFARTIRGDNGVLYHLPTAEYAIDSTTSGEQVRSAADSAAARTGKPRAVVVVRYDMGWWTGLAQVPAA